MEQEQQSWYGWFSDLVSKVGERIASFTFGQTLFKAAGNTLWMLEECVNLAIVKEEVAKPAKTESSGAPSPSVPEGSATAPSLSDATTKRATSRAFQTSHPDFIKQMPWILSLPIKMAVRGAAGTINVISWVVRRTPLEPQDIVKFIQSKRRTLRVIKYRGSRNIHRVHHVPVKRLRDQLEESGDESENEQETLADKIARLCENEDTDTDYEPEEMSAAEEDQSSGSTDLSVLDEEGTTAGPQVQGKAAEESADVNHPTGVRAEELKPENSASLTAGSSLNTLTEIEYLPHHASQLAQQNTPQKTTPEPAITTQVAPSSATDKKTLLMVTDEIPKLEDVDPKTKSALEGQYILKNLEVSEFPSVVEIAEKTPKETSEKINEGSQSVSGEAVKLSEELKKELPSLASQPTDTMQQIDVTVQHEVAPALQKTEKIEKKDSQVSPPGEQEVMQHEASPALQTTPKVEQESDIQHKDLSISQVDGESGRKVKDALSSDVQTSGNEAEQKDAPYMQKQIASTLQPEGEETGQILQLESSAKHEIGSMQSEKIVSHPSEETLLGSSSSFVSLNSASSESIESAVSVVSTGTVSEPKSKKSNILSGFFSSRKKNS